MSAVFVVDTAVSGMKEAITPTLITEWVKVGGALIAFIIGIRQYLRAQKWKRREFLAAQIKDFESDKKVQAALAMVDWSGRQIAFQPDFVTSPIPIKVDDDLLCSALVPHEEVEGFRTYEAFIRDCFDHLFDGLVRFHNFVEADLINVDELDPYLSYWIRAISGTRNKDFHCREVYTLLHNYILYYEFEGAQQLLEQFGYSIAPPKEDLKAAIRKVKERRPLMSSRGDDVV